MNTLRRRRRSRLGYGNFADLQPLVGRTLQFLERCPRGASRDDILSAMNLQPSAWVALRTALRDSGKVRVRGRGPGLRHVHVVHLPTDMIGSYDRDERLENARRALETLLREQGTIDSSDAQRATGFRADPARRLLLELVSQGKVERFGKKRSTRYRWVADDSES